MLKLLAVLFSLSYISSVAQPILTDSSLLIKPLFKMGETKTYLVTEEHKLDNPLISVKAEHQFKISFSVLDTTEGYSISYNVQTIKTSNKRFFIESVKARICNGLNLHYKLDKEGWLIDMPDYFQAQRRIIYVLDSIITTEVFDKNEFLSLSILRKSLIKIDGLEICLVPLLLFNDIFTKPQFRKQKDYHAASAMNIFYQPKIPGVLILELLKTGKDKTYSTIYLDFIGNRDSAAKYVTPFYQEIYRKFEGKSMKYIPDEMRFNYQREYKFLLNNGWPLKISNKRVEFYLQRSVSQTTMELIIDE